MLFTFLSSILSSFLCSIMSSLPLCLSLLFSAQSLTMLRTSAASNSKTTATIIKLRLFGFEKNPSCCRISSFLFSLISLPSFSFQLRGCGHLSDDLQLCSSFCFLLIKICRPCNWEYVAPWVLAFPPTNLEIEGVIRASTVFPAFATTCPLIYLIPDAYVIPAKCHRVFPVIICSMSTVSMATESAGLRNSSSISINRCSCWAKSSPSCISCPICFRIFRYVDNVVFLIGAYRPLVQFRFIVDSDLDDFLNMGEQLPLCA